jgi:hypothetical protein
MFELKDLQKARSDRIGRASEMIRSGRRPLSLLRKLRSRTMIVHALGMGLIPVDPSDIETMNFN